MYFIVYVRLLLHYRHNLWKIHGMDSFKIKGEKVSQLISCGYTLFSGKQAALPSAGCRRPSAAHRGSSY